MNVVKFGGSSISNSKNIKKVLKLIKTFDDKTIIIVSAIGKTTDLISPKSAKFDKKKMM